MLNRRLALASLVAVAACADEAGAPVAPSVMDSPQLGAAATAKGLSICAWGIASELSVASRLAFSMHKDGTVQIGQYFSFLEEPPFDLLFYIDSDPVGGLTTVHGDSLVTVQGSMPASSYSSVPSADPPPSDTVSVTLTLDLRLAVSPRRGTGWHPDGQGSSTSTRSMILSGTIDGTEIILSSDLAKALPRGRFGEGGAATPFNWFGTNGNVQFCTSRSFR